MTEAPPTTRDPRDPLARRWRAALVYGAPVLAIVAAGNLGAGRLLLTLVWTAAFGIMGAACVMNALQCGRVHCYFTGPLLLVASLASLLHGLRIVHLGAAGWEYIANIALLGGVLLYFVPEMIFGRYKPRTSDENR